MSNEKLWQLEAVEVIFESLDEHMQKALFKAMKNAKKDLAMELQHNKLVAIIHYVPAVFIEDEDAELEFLQNVFSEIDGYFPTNIEESIYYLKLQYQGDVEPPWHSGLDDPEIKMLIELNRLAQRGAGTSEIEGYLTQKYKELGWNNCNRT